MQAIFRRARSKSIDVHFEFDGGDSKTDGLFDLDIHYTLNHADGTGEETGTLKMFRHKEGNNWVSHLKTVAPGAHHGSPSIIPSMINNAQIDVVSDRETKFNLKYVYKYKMSDREIKFNRRSYVNKYKNRDVEINVDRIPGKKAHVTVGKSTGPKMIDLTFNLRQSDGNFNFGLAGTVAGEHISGSVEGGQVVHKDRPLGQSWQRFKVILTKGNRKALQVDAKVKADPANMRYSTKAVYAIIGGVIQGQVTMKYENKEFRLKHINQDTKDERDFRANCTIINDANTFDMNLEIQDTLHLFSLFHLYGIIDYYFSTNMLVWYVDFYQGISGVRIFVDKQNRNFLLPKFLIDVKLPSLVPCDGTEETQLNCLSNVQVQLEKNRIVI